MKKILLHLCLLLLTIIFACKKSETNLLDSTNLKGEELLKNQREDITSRLVNPGDLSFVYYSGGEYSASWGGTTLYFGSSFTVPTDNGWSFGDSWAPAGVTIYGNNVFESSQSGAFFSYTYGTYVNGIGINMGKASSEYYEDFSKYIKGDGSIQVVPSFDSYVTRFGGASTGLVTVTGQFIFDPNSPTKVSIVNSDFASNERKTHSLVVNGFIGKFTSGNDSYELYGANGTITRAYHYVNDVIVEEITDLTGIYLVGIRQPIILIDLTLYPNSNNEIKFNGINVPNIYW